MKELNIAAGIETFKLNGAFEVSFCPTDALFVEKLYNAFDAVDAKQTEYSALVEKAKDKEIFDIARRLDESIREIINGVFDCDVCSAVFGDVCIMALSDGLPLWANLMLAFIDEVDTSFAREQKRTNPRIQKYTSKYHR